jgi:hypothetical protein
MFCSFVIVLESLYKTYDQCAGLFLPQDHISHPLCRLYLSTAAACFLLIVWLLYSSRTITSVYKVAQF